MWIYHFIPNALKEYFRLLLTQKRYPGRNIGTPYVGTDVVLGEGCSLSRAVEVASGVNVGDWTYVNSGTIIASGTIGRFCSIGSNCQIGMADHPVDFLSTSPLLYGPRNVFGDGSHWDHYSHPPMIGSDVWISAQVFIRQGVTIGHGAIIGAGAVVVKDVPPYAIVAGVPARILKYRFPQETIDQLLHSRWWEMPIEDLRSVRSEFLTPIDSTLAESVTSTLGCTELNEQGVGLSHA